MARQKKGRAVHGVLLLDKPLGLSSNQVLQRVKWLFQAQKAGHTGALDPQASGLLPLCFGEATKFSQLLLDSEKAYETTAQLGEVRSTGDSEGEILSRAPVPVLSEHDIERVLTDFRGPVVQVPPMFSALKLDGKPLYELARQGMTQAEAQAIADKKRRTITIHELTLCSQRDTQLDLFVRCSKGTYIRTLVEDIGAAMGCGAYVSRLHRTATGPYQKEQMITLAELERIAEQDGVAGLDALLLPIDSALPTDWPVIMLDDVQTHKIRQGQALSTGLNDVPSVQLRSVIDGQDVLIGVARIEGGGIRPQRLLQF